MSTLKVDMKRAGMGSIELDGHDISKAVSGFSLEAYAGDLTRLRLDVVVVDTTQLGADHVQAFIPEATADLLVRLGWTRPEGRR